MYISYIKMKFKLCSSQRIFVWMIFDRQKFFSAISNFIAQGFWGSSWLPWKWSGPFCLWGSIKTEKSPSAHVWSCKIWLKHRMMLLFVSTDRYDPKEAYKHTCWSLGTNRKVFGATQSQASHSLKAIIFKVSKWSEPLLPLREHQNWKITISSRLEL